MTMPEFNSGAIDKVTGARGELTARAWRECRRSGKPPTPRADKANNGDKNVAKMHDVAELTLLKGDVLAGLDPAERKKEQREPDDSRTEQREKHTKRVRLCPTLVVRIVSRRNGR